MSQNIRKHPKTNQNTQNIPKQPRDKQGQARTMQGQTGTSRDIPYLSLLVPTCPFLSMLVPACPCLSLYVPVCPCLSLSVLVCPCMSLHWLYHHVYPLHQYEHSYIDFPCQSHCSNVCKPCFFNFFFITFHQASSITLSFNPNSSILVINITKGSTWFLSSFWYSLLFGLLPTAVDVSTDLRLGKIF